MHFKTLQTVSIYILMRKWTKHGWHRTRTYVAHKDTRYLEIQQSVQLVLDDGQRLDQLLCVHGAHHAVNTDKTGSKNAHKHTITAGTWWTKFKFWCKLRGFTKKEWSDDPKLCEACSKWTDILHTEASSVVQSAFLRCNKWETENTLINNETLLSWISVTQIQCHSTAAGLSEIEMIVCTHKTFRKDAPTFTWKHRAPGRL